jgi:hypothetical protein
MFETRKEAFISAGILIDPIVEKHEIEDIRDGAVFGPFTTSTAVNQHINHILYVADWLLKGE